MDFFKFIKKGRARHCEPKPLRIDGVRTVMTPQPDDAELAAQALLESLGSEECRVKSEEFAAATGNHRSALGRLLPKGRKKAQSSKLKAQSEVHDVGYYRQLSEKIRQTRAAEARLTMRYLAYCEQQLASPLFTDNSSLFTLHSSLNDMERELYKRQDIAEREGGELLRRWQHCLANVIVRQMSAATEEQATTDDEAADSPSEQEGRVV